MLKVVNKTQELDKRSAKTAVLISHGFVSSVYYLCVAWLQVVYTRFVQGAYTLGLYAGLGSGANPPEYKYYDLGTTKPPFKHLVVPHNFRYLTAVNQAVIPLIHTANKNNNKVNYLKSYLLLIPIRSHA
jgi:hypothetical protein